MGIFRDEQKAKEEKQKLIDFLYHWDKNPNLKSGFHVIPIESDI